MEYRIITQRILNRVSGVSDDVTIVVMTEQPIHNTDKTSRVYATFRADRRELRTKVRFHVKLDADRGGYADREVETQDLIRASISGGMPLLNFLQLEYAAATGERLTAI